MQAEPLKLRAEDQEDLAVMAAYLQDAVAQVADMRYLADARRFALVLRRYCWECDRDGDKSHAWVACGMHFDGVLAVKTAGFAAQDTDRYLELLTMHFLPQETPGGVVELVFAGGAAIRLAVECLDAQMRDMGARQTLDLRPRHAFNDGSDQTQDPS